MLLQERISNDMRSTTDMNRKNVLRVLVAELQRGATKVLSDAQTQAILKGCIKNENILLEHARTIADQDKSKYAISVLSEYVLTTAKVHPDEIKEWIVANIDFADHINKMSAMRRIMAHFGDTADGTTVKNVLLSL